MQDATVRTNLIFLPEEFDSVIGLVRTISEAIFSLCHASGFKISTFLITSIINFNHLTTLATARSSPYNYHFFILSIIPLKSWLLILCVLCVIFKCTYWTLKHIFKAIIFYFYIQIIMLFKTCFLMYINIFLYFRNPSVLGSGSIYIWSATGGGNTSVLTLCYTTLQVSFKMKISKFIINYVVQKGQQYNSTM